MKVIEVRKDRRMVSSRIEVDELETLQKLEERQDMSGWKIKTWY